MGKYVTYLRKTKARVDHRCDNCETIIPTGEYYYKETIEDKFLQSLHAKDFCVKCYGVYGDGLLFTKNKRKGNVGLDNFR